MAARYATQVFAGAAVTIMPGALRDTVAPPSDVAAIAMWPSNWTATPPAAGGTVTGILAGYLAVYPAGPQVS